MPEPSSRSTAVVVLAAGVGKRLKSNLPKVLHPVCGRPALWHVIHAASGARPERIVVVVHHGAEQVMEAVRQWGIRPEPSFVDQGQPLGTGHAVMVAEEAVGRAIDVLVMNGDDPLVAPEHVRRVMSLHRRSRSAATILTTEVDDPTGYGRVLRRGTELVDIVEEADASPEVKQIREISTIVYGFRRKDLFEALPLIGRGNRQNEYYLPQVLKVLQEKGRKVSATMVDLGGGLGLNTRAGLATVNRIMRGRILRTHMDNGVTVLDPAATYVDVGVRIGPDTVIHPLSFLEGETDRARRLGRPVRPRPSGYGAGGRSQGGLVRRDQGVAGRRPLEGAAPRVRGRRHHRTGHQRRSGDGHR